MTDAAFIAAYNRCGVRARAALDAGDLETFLRWHKAVERLVDAKYHWYDGSDDHWYDND